MHSSIKCGLRDATLKRICPIFFSLGFYAATEERLKERRDVTQGYVANHNVVERKLSSEAGHVDFVGVKF